MDLIRNTYRFIALIFALLILTTSMGFAVDMHYCRGQLKSISFFGKAKSCHEISKTTKKACPFHQQDDFEQDDKGIKKKDCCENKTKYFQADQDFTSKIFDLSINNQPSQFASTSIAVLPFVSTSQFAKPSYTYYKPPLITKDIPIFIQSFLL